jgi:hypothetical protein
MRFVAALCGQGHELAQAFRLLCQFCGLLDCPLLFFFGDGEEALLADNEGRYLLPPFLEGHSGLGQSVALVNDGKAQHAQLFEHLFKLAGALFQSGKCCLQQKRAPQRVDGLFRGNNDCRFRHHRDAL